MHHCQCTTLRVLTAAHSGTSSVSRPPRSRVINRTRARTPSMELLLGHERNAMFVIQAGSSVGAPLAHRRGPSMEIPMGVSVICTLVDRSYSPQLFQRFAKRCRIETPLHAWRRWRRSGKIVTHFGCPLELPPETNECWEKMIGPVIT